MIYKKSIKTRLIFNKNRRRKNRNVLKTFLSKNFNENFFYYDPLKIANHNLLFYYSCEVITTEFNDDFRIIEDENEEPVWFEIEKMNADMFISNGDNIINILNNLK